MVSDVSKTSGAARTWDLAAIIVAVLMLVAAWFLLVSPVLSEASATNDETATQEAANDVARLEVTALGRDFARIDEYRSVLSIMQEQITTTQRYADLQRLVAQVAEDNNVVIESLQFGTGTAIDAPEPEATEEPAQDEAAEAEPATTGDEEVQEAVKALFTGLFSISVDIELSGRYSDVLAAINQLQTGELRLVLINSVMLEPQGDDVEGSADADATKAEISGEVFVLADTEDLKLREEPVPTVDPSATPEPLPESDRNPLGTMGD